MKIALDIGHANNTGARGNGHEEHAVATVIAEHLYHALVARGHTVTVLDYPDKTNAEDLNATIRAANAGTYDIGISLHCDASDNPDARGAHICYTSASGKKLAEAIAVTLCADMPGRADKTVRRPNLAILKGTRPVWVLVECGFITNSRDCRVMTVTPELIAHDIALGIESYNNK